MLDRSLFSLLIFRASVAFVCVLLAFPFSAMAGFQWIPPTPGSGASMQGSEPSSSASQPVTRAPQTLQLHQAGAEETSGASVGGHVLLPPTPDKDKGKPLRGFANNVPLAVALRQILPAEYGFSVDQDVKLSTLVSWQGGRSWRPTLDDMLRSVGLGAREEGKMIQIVRGASAGGSLPSLQPPYDSKPVPLVPGGSVNSTMPSSVFVSRAFQPAPAHQGSGAGSWTADRGDTLHQVLGRWAQAANVELSWQAEYDYPLQASVTLAGSFEDAVRTLLVGFQEAQPQPVGSLHNGSGAGQTVLVVETRGNNYND
jgi:hypothetical protein